ncbi:MAG: hypothetical protein EAZ07_02350 [Cytophagales bacterium]|nr:MAG: hypothetical protein EAZ07_02350 [Cytophagales bacterium]
MNSSSYSTTKFINYLFASLFIIFGSLQSNIFEPNLLIVSILVGIVFLIQLWNALYPNTSNKRSEIFIYLLLLIGLGLSIFPLKLSNPFSIFHYSFVRSLFLISIPCILLWSEGDEKKQQNLVFYAPLFLLIFLNTYYILFDYSSGINIDQARHCGNAFLIYDLITGQDVNKFLQSLTYYDFYQPLVYLVSFPFLLIFGKSYTAATLSLPLFWLPLGYISAYKFLNKYARVNHAYASVFTFVIFGSVVATSLTKQLMLDFPALCMVCFYNYSLAKSGYLRNTKLSFYAGLVFGLGILTKSNFLLLALIPLLFSMIRLLTKCIQGKSEYKNLFFNIIIHLIAILLGGGFWYLINNDHYSFTLPSVTTLAGQNEGDPIPMSLSSFIWYPTKFIYYFSPLILGIILVGLYFSIVHWGKKKYMNYMSYSALILAYIIGTITWNKDVRTLLPATFYIFPALLGFSYLQNKLLRNSSLFLLVAITFLLNISFVNNNKLKIAQYLTTGPYTIPWEPTHPASGNQIEAYYIYQKLYKENFGNITPPQLNPSFINSQIHDKMYYSQYPIKYKVKLLDTTNYMVSFWRNFYMPDYYLFRTKCEQGHFYIQKIGEQKTIGGDIKVIIYKGSNSISEFQLNNNGEEMKIPINSNSSEITFAFREFHAWPSGQLSRFLFKIIGDKYYPGRDIPLYYYSSTDRPQVFSQQNLDFIKE